MASLKTLARNLRIEAHTAWLVARDPGISTGARLFGLALAAYALSPIDLIPDVIPVLGLLDEAILIPIGLWLFLKMVPPDIYARHKATATAASTRPISRAGAMAIVLIWAVALIWIAQLVRRAQGSA
ncbi:MAG: hypothetical protein RIR59_177 [Pseudomonadota bacterium]|jgi:uncharacterized membrane protein YkvA (DUF1232 family)